MTPSHESDSYPHQDGDATVLGPQVIASPDGSVINWRGENYYRSPIPNEDAREWWTLLEFTWENGMLVTMSLVQICETAREAAVRSAGLQLGDGCRPRRILVYPEAPAEFEWRQVRPYINDVGKQVTR